MIDTNKLIVSSEEYKNIFHEIIYGFRAGYEDNSSETSYTQFINGQSNCMIGYLLAVRAKKSGFSYSYYLGMHFVDAFMRENVIDREGRGMCL